MGQPEEDENRRDAMTVLGNGLHDVLRHEDALSVEVANLAMMQRLGDAEENILATQSNLATSYSMTGRDETAL